MDEHEQYQILMMGFLDEELSPEDQRRFREHAYQCAECAGELAKYQRLAEMATSVKLREPSDHEWDRFWNVLYNRIERVGGWVFLTIGALVLIAYAIYELAFEPSIHLVLRVGLLAGGAGLALLFVSVLRGRIRTARYDRYQGVKR